MSLFSVEMLYVIDFTIRISHKKFSINQSLNSRWNKIQQLTVI